MQVIRAKSAGFCLGVSLALKRLDRELDVCAAELGRVGRLITFGPIIHNPLVMRSYAARGVVCEDDPAAIGKGDRVVIRAHGIPREVEQRLQESGATLVDATCPKVKKAQLAIGKAFGKGRTLLLFGEKEHPEVKGLLSYAGVDSQVFGSLEELEDLRLDDARPYFLAAQTTQERAIYLEAHRLLSLRLGYKVARLDTICDATRDRQQEVLSLCSQVEALVVVGGLNSGNTRRLAEVARSQGTPTVHVEDVGGITEAIRKEILAGVTRVGLTAGASTPQEHIDAMRTCLESL